MISIILVLLLLVTPNVASAFDMGFNARATPGFVSDQPYAVPLLGEVFPHTYTNANGDSINGGYDGGGLSGGVFDRLNTNDPRIAGINYEPNGAGLSRSLVVDLSSGSAPGAGTYTIDLAVGDQAFAHPEDCIVYDNVTALITILATTGGGGHFFDATTADVTASGTWTGTTVSKSFASTTAKVTLDATSSGSDFTTLAHFRLTKAGGPPPQRSLTGVGL
jgi:hypothetical protein